MFLPILKMKIFLKFLNNLLLLYEKEIEGLEIPLLVHDI